MKKSVTLPTAVKSVIVLPTDPSLSVGGIVQFSAVASYNNGSSEDVTAQVSWYSSDPAVATVDAAGLATAAADGSAIISATFGGQTGSTALVVNVTLTSLAMTPTSANLGKGQTQQFTVSGAYSDGSSQNLTTSATWASLDTNVATINGAGLATAVGAGDAIIAVRTTTLAKAAPLTVTAPPIISTACDQLALARQQMLLLASGRATVSIETPQLGRVEFSQGSMADLQRLIDMLAAECAASLGQDTRLLRRRPISIEAWP